MDPEHEYMQTYWQFQNVTIYLTNRSLSSIEEKSNFNSCEMMHSFLELRLQEDKTKNCKMENKVFVVKLPIDTILMLFYNQDEISRTVSSCSPHTINAD